MEQNNYLDNLIRQHSGELSFAKERELLEAYQSGDEYAGELLTAHNIGLVIGFALKYSNFNDFEELKSEGLLGLAVAMKRFDLKSKNKFSTYATIWIKHFVLRYIDENSLITTPGYIKGLSIKYKRAVEEAKKIYGTQNPTDEMVKKALPDDFPVDKIEDIKDYNSIQISSLNVKIGEDEDSEVEDFQESDSFPMFLAKLDREDMLRAIQEALPLLSPKEKEIIKIMLVDEDNITFSQIGDRLGISGERARQLYNSGVEKIKKYVKLHYSDLMV